MTRKRLILSAVGLLVALLALPVLFLQYFNWNDHRDRVASWVGTAIQREVQISDRLGFQLWPTTKLSVSGLEISSPEGVSDLPLLKLQSGEAEFAIWPLLSGILVIDRLELDSPTVNLVSKLEEGATNWRFRLDETAIRPLILRKLQVSQAHIQYSDSDTQLDRDLHLSQLDWVLPEDVGDGAVTATGTFSGSALEVRGSLTPGGDDDLEAALHLVLGKISGELEGTVTEVMQGGNVDIRLALETSDLTQSVAMFVPGLTEQKKELFSGIARVSAVMRRRPGKDLRLEDIDVTTRSERLRITASGSISSLGEFLKRPAQGSAVSPTRLKVLAETEELGSLADLFKGRVPFKASAEAQGVLTGSLGDFRIEDVVIDASGEHAKLSATGYMDDLLSPHGWSIDFRAKSSTDQLGAFLKSYTHWDLPFIGKGVVLGRVSGREGDVDVSEIELQLESGSMTLNAHGEIGPIGPRAQFNIPFKITNITTDDLAVLANRFGYGDTVPVGLQGQVDAVLIGMRGDLHIRDIDLELASDIVTVNGGGNDGGTIGPLGKTAIFNIPISAESDDLIALVGAFGFDLPLGGQVKMLAVLGGIIGDLDLNRISANLVNPFGHLGLSGSITSLGPNVECDLGVDASVSDLVLLETALGWSLDQYPRLGFTSDAKLLCTDGQARLSNVSGVIKGKGIRSGQFFGQLPDLTDLASGSITVNLAVDDLGQFTSPLGLRTAVAVPARLSVNAVGAPQRGSSLFVFLDGVSDGMQIEINGQVNPSDKKTTFDLNSRFQADDVAKVSETFGLAIPLDGPLSLETKMRRDASQDSRTVNGVVRMSSNNFNAAAQGNFSWPLRSGNQVSLQFEALSLAHLSRWLPGDYLDPGPLRFESNFEIDDQNMPVGDFAVTLGNNDLSGNAHLQGIDLSKFPNLSVNAGEKIRVTGELKSSRLNTIEIFPSQNRIQENPESPESIFPSDPLGVAWVDYFDLDVQFDADDLVTLGFKARRLNSQIRTSDGKLDISARSGEFSGGTFKMNIGLDTRKSPYAVDFTFDINGLVLNRVPALKNVKLPLEGTLDVAIDLSGNGTSPKEIVSTSSGSFLARGDNAYIPASEFDLLTNSILVQVLTALNPKKKSEFHSLDCGVIGFRIVDGIAMSGDSVALQTSDVTYLIRGGFNLRDESVVFLVNPKARKGLGISASKLTNFYRIGGTLLEPRPEPDVWGVAKTAGAWGLAAWTGGLSIPVIALWDRFTGDKDACGIADRNQDLFLKESSDCVIHKWNQLQAPGQPRISIDADTSSCSPVAGDVGLKASEDD